MVITSSYSVYHIFLRTHHTLSMLLQLALSLTFVSFILDTASCATPSPSQMVSAGVNQNSTDRKSWRCHITTGPLPGKRLEHVSAIRSPLICCPYEDSPPPRTTLHATFFDGCGVGILLFLPSLIRIPSPIANPDLDDCQTKPRSKARQPPGLGATT